MRVLLPIEKKMLKIYSKKRLNTHMTECQNGQEHLIQQLMTEAESLRSKMDQVIEYLRASDLEHTKDYWSRNLVKSVLNRLMWQKKSLRDLLTPLAQIRLSLLNRLPKGERDISTTLPKVAKICPNLEHHYHPCKCVSSFFPGLMSQVTEQEMKE